MNIVDWGTHNEVPLYIYRNIDDFNFDTKNVDVITAEELINTYSTYFLNRFSTHDVTYCYDSKYICFYPEIEKMLGQARCISFNNPSSSTYVYLKEPNLFSNSVFKIIGDYIAMQVNQKCLFWTEFKIQSDIPYIISSTTIERIFNAEDFHEWISIYNKVVETEAKEDTGCLSSKDYFWIATENIDSFDLSAQWAGNDNELNKLPLFVDINQIILERVMDSEQRKLINRGMQVSLDDNYKIHIKYYK